MICDTCLCNHKNKTCSPNIFDNGVSGCSRYQDQGEGMINNNLNPEQTVEFLNKALELDREAISALFLHKTPAGRALAEHPTIQIGGDSISPLGLLNGLFGVYDDGPHKNWGPITAVYDEETNLIEKFEITENK